MSDFLRQAEQHLAEGLFRDHGEELEVFEDLLDKAGVERVEFCKWQYHENQLGFITTRKKAGLLLYAQNSKEFWSATEKLLLSENLDDRDVAFSTLINLNDPKRFKMIKQLSEDEYLRFDVLDYLQSYFPTDVLSYLKKLSNHEDIRVRQLANQRLNNFGEDCQ